MQNGTFGCRSRFVLIPPSSMPRVEGKNLYGLMQEDLPLLADLMEICIRKEGRVVVFDAGDTRCVSLSGRGLRINVLEKDWLKIVPFLQNSQLDPTTYPVTTGSVSLGSYDASWASMRDTEFRDRILGILKTLFTRKFPNNPI